MASIEEKLAGLLAERDMEISKLQAIIEQLEAEIEALQKELVEEANQFHSKQYCKCNWCQMAKDQALQKEAKELVWSKRAKTLKMKVHKLLNDQWTICGMYNNRRRVTTTREDTTCERCIRIYDNNVAKQKEAKE